MNGNSILLGRVSGIPIRAHILLLIALPLFMTWFITPNPLMGLVGAIGLFTSVALHELGHSIVAQRKGSHIQEIVLYPFGGAAKMSNIPSKPVDEIQVALAGPAVSLLLGIAGTFIGIRILLNQPEGAPYPLSLQLGVLNIVLFIFNLFPVFPMDGGRVLRALLATKKSRVDATRIAVTVGKYFCAFFVVYGLWQTNLLLAFIGGYIYFAGQAEYRQVRLEHQARHFSGFSDNNPDVEVSPPPYAASAPRQEGLGEKLKKLFRG
jgi:Zn-dependent protease